MGRKAKAKETRRQGPATFEEAQPEYRHLTGPEKRALGMPLGAFGIYHAFEAGIIAPRWAGYRIVHVGRMLPVLVSDNPLDPVPPTPWPYWEIVYPGLGSVPMQVWIRIVQHDKSPGYAEARWSPQMGEAKIDLHGLERCRTDQERKIAYDADKLLRFEVTLGGTGGRPRKAPDAKPDRTIANFAERYPREYALWREAHYGERPTQLDLAGEFGVSERTLQRHIRDNGLTWPPDA